MKLNFSVEDEHFRNKVHEWLSEYLVGDFANLRYRGGPGDESAFVELRKLWEKVLAKSRWTCIGWPTEYGGRGCSITQQVIFHEEYARVGGPGRLGHIGEGLLGPTLIAMGSQKQKERYLPEICAGKKLWCQGYSEPDAGSDLCNVKTTARLDKNKKKWFINGQKVWTSLAHESDYCFVLARVKKQSVRHNGLGFFLVPMHQSGISVNGIKQLTGTSEFNEVFFDDAECDIDDIVGKPGEGWKIAMRLLEFERGVSTLGQQMLFQNELNEIISLAKKNGAALNPSIRQKIAKAHIGLKIMRYNSLRMLSSNGDSGLQESALVYKLYWSNWHRDLGELVMQVLGPEGEITQGEPYNLTRLQAMSLFVRSDTIYGGSNEIQRNIIAERGLGMPKEKR